MTTYLSNRDSGGKTNEEGHYRFQTNVWEGNVLNGLTVEQASSPNMTVRVNSGDIRIPYQSYAYTAWNDSYATVTIATADTSNPRLDRIVAYIDRSLTYTIADTNNPGALKFKAVSGTAAASPTKINDAGVQSSVGASNPWCEIATVLVAANVTQVTTANISDTRTLIKIGTNTVNNASILNGSVTPAKWTNQYKFSVYRNSAQAIAAGATAKVNFDTEEYDSNNNYDSTTNFRYVAPVAGFYKFDSTVSISAAATKAYVIFLYKNGVEYKRGSQIVNGAAGSDVNLVVSPPPMQLAANDYIEIFFYNGDAGSNGLQVGASRTYFGGFLVSQA